MTDSVKLTAEVESHDKLQRRILFIKSVALLLSIVIALLGATVAWFKSVREVSATGMSVRTQAPEATGFNIGDSNHPINPITLPCAIVFNSSSVYNNIKDGFIVQEYYITNVSENDYAYMKIETHTPCLKVMYLGQKSSQNPISFSQLLFNAWKQHIADPSKQQNYFKPIEGTTQISFTSQTSKYIYIAFFADYNAEYRDGMTLGQFLKTGSTDSALTFDIDVKVSKNPIT